MEELFNILSSSARLDKSKRRPKKRSRLSSDEEQYIHQHDEDNDDDDNSDGNNDDDDDDDGAAAGASGTKSRDRTGKRDRSKEKLRQVHKEKMAAFRRSMAIQVADKHDPALSDPISTFSEVKRPGWWRLGDDKSGGSFDGIYRSILRNVEAGRWKELTPIQMQAIPSLLDRRDFIGAAPTGSGKSGAFIVPTLLLSGAPHGAFYGNASRGDVVGRDPSTLSRKKRSNSQEKSEAEEEDDEGTTEVGRPQRHRRRQKQQGERIRSLLLAPSLELASQLHREVERLGAGRPGGLLTALLSKSNAAHCVAGTVGGKTGIDVLVSTPLRLVDAIERGLKLDGVRMVVLDEADRLLDAADGATKDRKKKAAKAKEGVPKGGDDVDEVNDEEDDNQDDVVKSKPSSKGGGQGVASYASGSTQTRSFLAQMDIILGQVPPTATRALFSATVTEAVRFMAESILRDPVDVIIGKPGGANTDIDQELLFCGKEQGKLLALRQLMQRGRLLPPALVFTESQERAQALFGELLYDGMHVDVIHAGRSKSARTAAVERFRRGDTWLLICTDLVARGVDFRAVRQVINYDLPASGITYVHRIGRTGRAGRRGTAITLFTEADFDHLRTIANVMKQSGCRVEDWMLRLPKGGGKNENSRLRGSNRNGKRRRGRTPIDTTPWYDKNKNRKRQQIIKHNKDNKNKVEVKDRDMDRGG